MPAGLVVFALAGGSFIILGVMIVFFFAVVFGFFTRTGSGIDEHPNDGLDGAPGSEALGHESGTGRSSGETSQDHSVGDTFSTHGTG